MNSISPISAGPLRTATQAIKNSLARVDQDAHIVANSQTVDSVNTVHALVDAKQQVLYTKAAARVISTTDEMVKSLLNSRA
jgi:hypothetical protein